MTDTTGSFNPSELILYAGDTQETWKALIGQTVRHSMLGTGRIEAIEANTYIMVVFDQPYEGETQRRFNKAAFQTVKYFTEMSVPAFLLEQVKLKKARVDEERRLAEEARRRAEEEERRREEEAEAAQDFARLRAKFNTSRYPETSPLSPLYKILLQLEEGAALGEREIHWLEAQKLFGPLAYHYEVEFKRTNDPWILARASSYCRKSHSSQRAIELTAGFYSDDKPAMAAVQTSRGGAFRDIKELDEAERCGFRAIDYNPDSYHPYNLLGAVYYQKGDPEQGDAYFEKAAELGASPNSRDTEIRSAVEDAKDIVRSKVAEYLLRKDPRRYEWAQRYLR